MADKIMLLDGNSLINRAYYGLNSRNPLTAPDGTPTGALYAFMNMLMKYLDDIKPQYACAAFDLKEPTFRHKAYDQYKGTRKPMPDDLAVQMPLLKELLDSLGIARFELAGYEADDILGTLSLHAEKQGLDVVMITGDKDSFQLVSDKTIVYQPVTRGGRSDTQIVDIAYIKDKYNVLPDQLIDIKAIMGDSSDNIPGVRGIGEKGAISLISQYGSLKSVYEHLDDITTSQAKKLAESKEMAELSYELATICRSVPVASDIEQWIITETDKRSLHELFMKYGFRSLVEKFGLGSVKNESEKKDQTEIQFEQIFDVEHIIQFINKSANKSDISLIVQKFDIDHFAAAAVDNLSSGQDIVLTKGLLIKLLEKLEDSTFSSASGSVNKLTLIGFDLKSLLADLGCRPFQIEAHDIMIAGYLLDQLDGKPDFGRLYQSVIGDAWEEAETAPKQLALDLDQLASGNGPDDSSAKEHDLQAQRKRFNAYSIIAKKQKELFAADSRLSRLMYEIEMPLVYVLRRMEQAGFLLDHEALEELAVEMEQQMLELTEAIYNLSGEEFNLNSPKQLGVVLFEKLGLQTGKKRSGGNYSTDADELERLRDDHPVIEKILTFRQISKLKSTFVDGLKRAADVKDGRVRTTFSQVQTATGRLSSSEPNLQNIPVRTEAGTRIRKVFISSPDHVLLDADYSQIELRLLAHLSQDVAMMEAFINNQDIHLNTACSIFGLPPEMISPDQRSAAKTVNFSIVYGISDFGLARDLRISLKKAHEYISGYNSRYPGVRAYLDSLVEAARNRGYVETMLGRRRYVTELKSSNRNIRMFGERAAMNAPIQGTAADMIKLAMVRVDHAFRQQGLSARLILQVHDELIVEAPKSEADQASKILRGSMEQVVKLSVPLIAEVHQGLNWAECK